MPFTLALLILLGALVPVDSAKRKSPQVRFLNITTTFNPKLSTLVEFSITPESNGRFIDLNWKLSVEVPKSFYIAVDLLKGNPSESAYTTVFSYDFDYCRVWDGFMSQEIARMWFNDIKRVGTFPAKCPISKGFYYLKHFQVTKGSVPPFAPMGFYVTKVMVYIKRDTYKDVLFTTLMEIEMWLG